MKILTSVLIIFFASEYYDADAQSTGTPLEEKDIILRYDSRRLAADISFKVEEQIDDLTLIVSDDKGQTVFLDNKQRFKGEYKKHIDLNEYGKGEYSISIKAENFEIRKQITF